jgi:hypothetical protein
VVKIKAILMLDTESVSEKLMYLNHMTQLTARKNSVEDRHIDS